MTNYDCRITYEETSGGRSILIMLHVKIEMSIVFGDNTETFTARVYVPIVIALHSRSCMFFPTF